MSHVAVILPGRAYPPVGPALRVPALALAECGAELREVTYPDTALGPEMVAVVQAAMAGATRVTFVAKSLGTALLAEIGAALTPPAAVEAVWVTPLFYQPEVRHAAGALGWRSILVSGSADSTYDAAATDAVAKSLNAECVVIDGADHSLEVAGDVLATVAGWRRVGEAVLRFARG